MNIDEKPNHNISNINPVFNLRKHDWFNNRNSTQFIYSVDRVTCFLKNQPRKQIKLFHGIKCFFLFFSFFLVGIEWNFLNMTNVLYHTPTANFMLNCKILK